MTEEDAIARRLDREAHVLGAYLAGCAPSPLVLRKYGAFHRVHDITDGRGVTRFDRLLLGLTRMGRLGARLADVYASRFRKRGVLRRKLILMLALLESAPPTYERFDAPTGGGRVLFWFKAVARAVGESLLLLVSAALLLPLQGVLALVPGRTEGGAA